MGLFSSGYNYIKKTVKRAYNDARSLFSPKRKGNLKDVFKKIKPKFRNTKSSIETMDELMKAFLDTRQHIIRQAIIDNLCLDGIYVNEPKNFSFNYVLSENKKIKEKSFEKILDKLGYFEPEGIEIDINNLGKIKRTKEENQSIFMSLLSTFGDKIGIKGNLGLCCILGQVAHESGSFKYMEEIASGEAYEGRTDLGNTQPGDGKRFKGRGPVQVTGRANYKGIFEKFFKPNGLGNIDIVNHPELGSDAQIGSLLTIGWFLMTSNGKRAIQAANEGKVKTCTKAINGGYNGLADRQRRTLQYAKEMGIDTSLIKLEA